MIRSNRKVQKGIAFDPNLLKLIDKLAICMECNRSELVNELLMSIAPKVWKRYIRGVEIYAQKPIRK